MYTTTVDPNWTLIFSVFPTLTLEHVLKSLYTVKRQSIQPAEVVVFDNASGIEAVDLMRVARFYFAGHWNKGGNIQMMLHGGGQARSAGWAQNRAICAASNERFVLMRADHLYAPEFCETVLAAVTEPRCLASTHMFNMGYTAGSEDEDVSKFDIDIDRFGWQSNVHNLRHHPHGKVYTGAEMDAAAFASTKEAVELGGWYDERLQSWGFWQSQLQIKMRERGVRIHVCPQVLFYHMFHQVRRDFKQAYRELYDTWRADGRVPRDWKGKEE